MSQPNAVLVDGKAAYRPSPNYVWRAGYQGIYINPGHELHGRTMFVDYRDPCGKPGLTCVLDRPDGNQFVAIDEDKLWLYVRKTW